MKLNSDETVQSTSMLKSISIAMLAGVSMLGGSLSSAAAMDARSATSFQVIYADRSAPVRTASAGGGNLGGGFIEFLFGDEPGSPQGYPAAPSYDRRPVYQPQPQGLTQPPMQQQVIYPREDGAEAARSGFDPRYEKQVVAYHGKERPGTVVVDTPNKFLYLVQPGGTALRYGIGVGRPGFTWSGVKSITAKKEWPSWTPPAEMLKRRPDLPRFMEGGPENPLGARAMYLGSTLYRIHGSNEPWTIGTNVSSGCIRMRNEDVMDLYERVNVGTRVVVI